MAKLKKTDTTGCHTEKPRTDKYSPAELSSTQATFGGSSERQEPSPIPVLAISKPTLSLRAAFFSPAELPPAARISPSKTAHQATSIAPFFNNSRTTFRDGQATPRSPPQELERVPTAEPDASDLIKNLKKNYLDTAEMLHERAVIRLRQVYSELSRKLVEALSNDSAVLALVEKQHKTLCKPLAQFQIRYRQRDPADGSVREETSTVGDIVATAQSNLKGFEADLKSLWCEWETAQAEVVAARCETLEDETGGDDILENNEPEMAYAGDPDKGNEDEAGRKNGNECVDSSMNLVDIEPLNLGELTLAKFRSLVNQELEDAEKAMGKLCDDAVAKLKEIDEEYGKATSSDLHIFSVY